MAFASAFVVGSSASASSKGSAVASACWGRLGFPLELRSPCQHSCLDCRPFEVASASATFASIASTLAAFAEGSSASTASTSAESALGSAASVALAYLVLEHRQSTG